MNDMMAVIWHKHKDTFFHALSSIRNSEEYCDATIACDGHFYKVHKFIMSTCSEYFNKMFKEANSQGSLFSHPVIVLQDIKHEQLEALLDYMYQGEVNVLKDELSGVMKAAQGLKIKGIGVSANNQEKEIYYENEMEDANELRPRKGKLVSKHQNDNSSHSVPEKRLQVKLKRLKVDKDETSEKIDDNDNLQDASEFKIKKKNPVNSRTKKIKIQAENSNESELCNEDYGIDLTESFSADDFEAVTCFKALNKKESNYEKPGCSSQNKRKKKRGRRPNPVCKEVLESDYKSPGDVWVQSFKSITKGVACPFCTKVYHNKSNFIYHYENHNPIALTCPNCPYTSKRRRDLTKHINTSHKNQNLLCPHCSNTFQHKLDLTKHINTFHSPTHINPGTGDISQDGSGTGDISQDGPGTGGISQDGPHFQEPQKNPNEDGMVKEEPIHLNIAESSGVELNEIISLENQDNINERMTMMDIYLPSTDMEEATN